MCSRLEALAATVGATWMAALVGEGEVEAVAAAAARSAVSKDRAVVRLVLPPTESLALNVGARANVAPAC